MNYKTFAEIKSKVEMDLDTEVEEFIQPDEFRRYVNNAIAIAESHIHKLGLEDEYFLTKAFLPLVTGEEDIVLPTNMYMNKIRAVIYKYGTTIYTIARLRSKNRFEDIEVIGLYNSVTDFYKYLLRNDTAAGGIKFQLIPPSRETSSQNVKLWYIRRANTWDDVNVDTTFCDLPEVAQEFLYAYVSYKCLFKEGHASTPEAKADLEEIKQQMITTMEQMVADDDTEIIKDLSSYEDMS